MNSGPWEQAARVLGRDRIWSAYALADLDPPHAAHATWLASELAAVLTYTGFQPPVLFAAGAPDEVRLLFEQIPADRYLFTLIPTHRALLDDRILESHETVMWRMVLRPEAFDPSLAKDVQPLTLEDLPELEALFETGTDRPDAFDPGQLADQAFFGIRRAGHLVSVAGTHVVSVLRGVAAVGNVYTHPAHRGQGLATRTTAAVVQALLQRPGLRTIVLNVARENAAALHCYQRLGFWPFCGYHEGVGRLGPASYSPQESRVP